MKYLVIPAKKKKQGCFQEPEKRQREWGEMETRLKACCVGDNSADAPENCFAFFILAVERGCETLPTFAFYLFASAAPAVEEGWVFPSCEISSCVDAHTLCSRPRNICGREVRWLGRIPANIGESFAWKERGEKK